MKGSYGLARFSVFSLSGLSMLFGNADLMKSFLPTDLLDKLQAHLTRVCASVLPELASTGTLSTSLGARIHVVLTPPAHCINTAFSTFNGFGGVMPQLKGVISWTYHLKCLQCTG